MTAHRVRKDLMRGIERHHTTDPGDAGTITVDGANDYVQLVSAAAETRTLNRPTSIGQSVILNMQTDGGDITMTVTGGFDEAGNTTLTFADPGQVCELYAVAVDDTPTYQWRVRTFDGVAGPTVDMGTGLFSSVTTDTVSESTTGSGVAVDSGIIRDGMFHGVQGAPTAETGVATIAIADMLTGIVTLSHTTGSTVALTVDTGTAMDTGMPASFGVGSYIDWYVINLSAALADTGTLTAASGHTLVGEAVVESAHADSEFQSSAHFRSRRTAANTWITYRLS